jgi:hypothetical protein
MTAVLDALLLTTLQIRLGQKAGDPGNIKRHPKLELFQSLQNFILLLDITPLRL